MTNPYYTLTMAKNGGIGSPIAASSLQPELVEAITRIAKALTIAEFRGNVQFYVMMGTNVVRASDVTFTDDVPTGIWNNSTP